MTVGLFPMGAGTTEVGLTAPQVFLNSEFEYRPVEVSGDTIEVKGDCAPFATATPLTTATPTIVPPPTPAPAPPYGDATPVVAPDRCPAGYGLYNSLAFSICYPDGWQAKQRPSSAQYPEAVLLQTQRVSIGFELVGSTPVSSGAVPDMATLCRIYGDVNNIQFELRSMPTVDGVVEACVGRGDAGEGGWDPMYAFLTLDDRRYLRIEAIFDATGIADSGIVEQVLQTLETQ